MERVSVYCWVYFGSVLHFSVGYFSVGYGEGCFFSKFSVACCFGDGLFVLIFVEWLGQEEFLPF